MAAVYRVGRDRISYYKCGGQEKLDVWFPTATGAVARKPLANLLVRLTSSLPSALDVLSTHSITLFLTPTIFIC